MDTDSEKWTPHQILEDNIDACSKQHRGFLYAWMHNS